MISVILTTYNGTRYIIDQLESIRTQTMPVDEVLICDDVSTDDTVEVVRRYMNERALSGWSLIMNEKNKGPSENLLDHLKDLTGEIVFFADQDDVWEPRKVAQIVGRLNAGNDCMLVSSRGISISASGEILDRQPEWSRRRQVGFRQHEAKETQFGLGDVMEHTDVPLHSLAVKRAVVDKVIDFGWPSGLNRSVGVDWYIEVVACLLGYCVVLDDELVRRRVHEDNYSLAGLRKRSALTVSQRDRISSLRFARDAHAYLLSESRAQLLDSGSRIILQRAVKFFDQRLVLFSEPTIRNVAYLAMFAPDYRAAYGSIWYSLRALVSDLAYAWSINPRLPWGRLLK